MLLVEDAVARRRYTSEAWLALAGRLYPALLRTLTGVTILVLRRWMLSDAINRLSIFPGPSPATGQRLRSTR